MKGGIDWGNKEQMFRPKIKQEAMQKSNVRPDNDAFYHKRGLIYVRSVEIFIDALNDPKNRMIVRSLSVNECNSTPNEDKKIWFLLHFKIYFEPSKNRTFKNSKIEI